MNASNMSYCNRLPLILLTVTRNNAIPLQVGALVFSPKHARIFVVFVPPIRVSFDLAGGDGASVLRSRRSLSRSAVAKMRLWKNKPNENLVADHVASTPFFYKDIGGVFDKIYGILIARLMPGA